MAEPGKYLIGESLRDKLKSTIAKVDSIPFGGPVFRLPHGGISDGPAYVPKVFRVCTATGEWPVDSSKDVKFYGVESTPNTVSVLNQLVSLPAPKSTATSRIVNIAKDGTQWYLVSFQMSSKTAIMATNTQTISFLSSANTQTLSFAGAGEEKTLTFVSSVTERSLTYVSSVSDVEVIASVSASLNTSDCKITVITTTTKIKTANNPQTTTFKVANDPTTTTFKTAGSSQTATIVSLANTQTATIMTGTYTATFISLEI
jgi:hypothetical protein